MAKKGTAQGTVTLDYSQFEVAGNAIMSICKDINDVMKTTLGVAFGEMISSAVQGAVGYLKEFIVSAKDHVIAVAKMGEEMANLSHATGIAASSFAIFRMAMEKGISMGEASQLLGRNAELIQKDASVFRDVAIRLEGVSQRFEGFWIGFADKVAPVVNMFLEKIGNMDFSVWGQRIGDAFAESFSVLYGLIKNGNVWEAISVSLKLGFAEATNYLTYGANVFVSVMTTFFAELPYLIIKGFSEGFKYVKEDAVHLLDVFNMVTNPGGYLGGKIGQNISMTPAQASVGAAAKKVEFQDFNGAGELKKQLQELFGKAKATTTADITTTDQYSNHKALQNFGVDSLQKLGLGGTVNGPGGGADPLVTYASKSYEQLAAIRASLEKNQADKHQISTDPRQQGPVKVTIKSN